MILAALAAAAAAYALGLLRIARVRRRFPARSIVCFMLGLIAVGAALSPALDERADAALSWHMVQHLVVLNIAAPLLLLGAPLRLALAALPPRGATQLAVVFRSTPIRALTHPAIAWLSFAAVLYGSHFSPLYNLALENPPLHVLEHTLYLGAALLFWTPLLAVAPAPHAPPHTLRLLAVDAVEKANSGHPGAPLGCAPIATLLWTVADWAALERRYGSLADAGTP